MAFNTANLQALGWDDAWSTAFGPYQAQGLEPARVAIEDKQHYLLFAAEGELPAHVTGRLRRSARSPAQLPKVGDWVACRRVAGESKALIHHLVPRRTQLSRKVPGRPLEEQVLAANVDLAFVVQACDASFNPRRLERYVLMVRQAGVQPVVLINKTDLAADAPALVAEATQRSGGALVLAVSATTGCGFNRIREFIKPGQTLVFIGTSGVGKSSLINRLHGEEIQATTEVRESDAKGRHTTSWRELFVVPGGGLVIDTPGMREFHLWMGSEGVAEAFPEIQELADRCRFRDCQHSGEPGCAVRAASGNGALAVERYQGYLKLKREVQELERAGQYRRAPGRPRPKASLSDENEDEGA